MPQNVTVEEAKTKWCRHGREPFSKDVNYSDGAGIAVAAVNRMSSGGASTMCFGNGCMAWTWADPKALTIEERKGFCGAETW